MYGLFSRSVKIFLRKRPLSKVRNRPEKSIDSVILKMYIVMKFNVSFHP